MIRVERWKFTVVWRFTIVADCCANFLCSQFLFCQITPKGQNSTLNKVSFQWLCLGMCLIVLTVFSGYSSELCSDKNQRSIGTISQQKTFVVFLFAAEWIIIELTIGFEKFRVDNQSTKVPLCFFLTQIYLQ